MILIFSCSDLALIKKAIDRSLKLKEIVLIPIDDAERLQHILERISRHIDEAKNDKES